MADRVGQQLGDYRLLRVLGEGAFGSVYLAEHVHLGQQAAVKVLTSRATLHERERWFRELRPLVTLKHRHILPLLDYGEFESGVYLVMEYAPNGSLQERYPRGHRQSPLTILPYVRQIAAGLQYAHDRQVVHLDIKPTNILLDRQEQVLISDFGLVMILPAYATHQSVESFAGAPLYMAPEQMQGKPGKAKIRDQYALATMAYEWLTGKLPFEGSTAWSIVAQKTTQDPPPLHQHAPDLSPAVAAVVMRALSRNPDRRFESVQAFAEALAEAALSVAPQQIEEELTREGYTFWQANRYAKVLAAFEQALQRAPTDAGVWYEKGQALYSLGRPDEALAAYERALQLDPTDARLWDGKGQALRSLRRPVEAKLAFVRARALEKAARSAPFAPALRASLAPAKTAPLILRRHRDLVHAVAWSPDGRLLASGGGMPSWLDDQDDLAVYLWSAASGLPLRALPGHTDQITALAWAPDGRRLASASADMTVRLWDTASGRPLHSFERHTGWVEAVAWSPDSRRLASTGVDQTVRLWDAASGQELFTCTGHTDSVFALAWSPDGHTLASASADKTVRLWDAESGEPLTTLDGHTSWVEAVAWSPDGRFLASAGADGTVRVWDAQSSRLLLTLTGSTEAIHSIAWSPDGRRLASAGDDQQVSLWDAATGKLLYTYTGHSDAVHAVAWSPDGTRIASAGQDTTVQVWSAEQSDAGVLQR